jgi:hypothetical protein
MTMQRWPDFSGGGLVGPTWRANSFLGGFSSKCALPTRYN